jgi:hypothetical protein
LYEAPFFDIGISYTDILDNLAQDHWNLIQIGYFPEDAYLGRMPFVGIKTMVRAAISVKPDRLHRMRDRLIMYALEKGYEPDELLRVLNFCSINAASNGVFEFESVVCQKSFRVLRGLPVSVRKGVLEGRYKTINLFNAV